MYSLEFHLCNVRPVFQYAPYVCSTLTCNKFRKVGLYCMHPCGTVCAQCHFITRTFVRIKKYFITVYIIFVLVARTGSNRYAVFLVTVFRDIHNHGFLPTEQKVTNGRT